MYTRTSSFHKIRRRHYVDHAAGATIPIMETPGGGGRQATTSQVASTLTSSDRELQLVKNISDRLETGLNEHALKAIMELLQRGEHPDAIVAAVTSLSQRAAASGGS